MINQRAKARRKRRIYNLVAGGDPRVSSDKIMLYIPSNCYSTNDKAATLFSIATHVIFCFFPHIGGTSFGEWKFGFWHIFSLWLLKPGLIVGKEANILPFCLGLVSLRVMDIQLGIQLQSDRGKIQTSRGY